MRKTASNYFDGSLIKSDFLKYESIKKYLALLKVKINDLHRSKVEPNMIQKIGNKDCKKSNAYWPEKYNKGDQKAP